MQPITTGRGDWSISLPIQMLISSKTPSQTPSNNVWATGCPEKLTHESWPHFPKEKQYSVCVLEVRLQGVCLQTCFTSRRHTPWPLKHKPDALPSHKSSGCEVVPWATGQVSQRWLLCLPSARFKDKEDWGQKHLNYLLKASQLLSGKAWTRVGNNLLGTYSGWANRPVPHYTLFWLILTVTLYAIIIPILQMKKLRLIKIGNFTQSRQWDSGLELTSLWF